MGEVCRARDTRLGRHVAIKTLPADFAHDAKLKIKEMEKFFTLIIEPTEKKILEKLNRK